MALCSTCEPPAIGSCSPALRGSPANTCGRHSSIERQKSNTSSWPPYSCANNTDSLQYSPRGPGTTASHENDILAVSDNFLDIPVDCNSPSESLYPSRDLLVGHSTHARPHLQAFEDRHAIRPSEHQGLGSRFRAGATAARRTVDGLDFLRRYAPAIALALRQQGRGHCLLRARRDCLSDLRDRTGEKAHDILRGQFLLQAPRRVDPLIVILHASSKSIRQLLCKVLSSKPRLVLVRFK